MWHHLQKQVSTLKEEILRSGLRTSESGHRLLGSLQAESAGVFMVTVVSRRHPFEEKERNWKRKASLRGLTGGCERENKAGDVK